MNATSKIGSSRNESLNRAEHSLAAFKPPDPSTREHRRCDLVLCWAELSIFPEAQLTFTVNTEFIIQLQFQNDTQSIHITSVHDPLVKYIIDTYSNVAIKDVEINKANALALTLEERKKSICFYIFLLSTSALERGGLGASFEVYYRKLCKALKRCCKLI